MHLREFSGDVQCMDLTFEVFYSAYDQPVPKLLVPDGSKVTVTNENKEGCL